MNEDKTLDPANADTRKALRQGAPCSPPCSGPHRTTGTWTP